MKSRATNRQKGCAMSDVFKKLSAINVSSKIEKKQGLTYLSWPLAWAEVCKNYDDVYYNIIRDKDTNLPYVYDESTGFMVFTTVSIGGITHEMWLPVMNGANKAMKKMPYSYKVRSGEKSVDAATMFDVNKTIMRCLVKNLAMFGLGLNIYAGEDLPITPTLPSEQEVRNWLGNGETKDSILNHIAGLGCDITTEFTEMVEAI